MYVIVIGIKAWKRLDVIIDNELSLGFHEWLIFLEILLYHCFYESLNSYVIFLMIFETPFASLINIRPLFLSLSLILVMIISLLNYELKFSNHVY
jgi:hypothetical protein